MALIWETGNLYDTHKGWLGEIGIWSMCSEEFGLIIYICISLKKKPSSKTNYIQIVWHLKEICQCCSVKHNKYMQLAHNNKLLKLRALNDLLSPNPFQLQWKPGAWPYFTYQFIMLPTPNNKAAISYLIHFSLWSLTLQMGLKQGLEEGTVTVSKGVDTLQRHPSPLTSPMDVHFAWSSPPWGPLPVHQYCHQNMVPLGIY